MSNLEFVVPVAGERVQRGVEPGGIRHGKSKQIRVVLDRENNVRFR